MKVAAWPATTARTGAPRRRAARLVLHDEHRAALGGHEAAGLGGERAVGAVRVVDGAQLLVAELADHRVRGERRLGGADHHRVGAAPHGPRRVREGVQAAGLVAGDDPAGALEAAADGDLAGARGVEPGDGLVRADEAGALAPQLLQFALAELAAAGAGGGDHAHGERRGVGRRPAEPGVVEGEVGRGHREVGEPVGLDEVALLDQRAGGSKSRTSPATRSGRCSQPSRVTRSRTLMPSLVDFQNVSVLAPLGATTPMPVTTARRGRSVAHRVLPLGRVMTTADWNPPNPLPTESTLRSFRGAGGARHVVQVALGVGGLVVRGRRHHLVGQGQDAGDDLDRADGAQRVAHHGLDGAHGRLVGVRAQRPLDRGRLVPVVLLGARAVRVDVVDLPCGRCRAWSRASSMAWAISRPSVVSPVMW